MCKSPVGLFLLLAVAAAHAACQSKPAEPEPPAKSEPAATPAPTPVASQVIPAATGATPPAGSTKTSANGDPWTGQFTLAHATEGLGGSGKLIADIKTDAGKLECELFEDKAPITVANFVGLARGKRPWKTPQGEWVTRAAYDGTTFHRIIKGFMIQGGDAAGTGAGDPGYVIPDEVWDGARHDQRGLLCMANRGKHTNGMQFFILDAPAPHLDGGYTIFGKCGPDSVIEKLANSEVRGDRAVNPPKIESVKIRRGKPKG